MKRSSIFNALDQFLYAKRIYFQEKNEPQYSRQLSLTQQIDGLKETSMFKMLRERNKTIAGLAFFTLPTFQYVFKAAHVLSRAGFDEDDIFQLARVLASNTTNNEAVTQILKNPVDQQLELRMLQRIDFKVAFDYFEDYIDSAIAKLLRIAQKDPQQTEMRDFERAVRFVTMMVQVSGASEEFAPHVLAVFVVCEAFLLAWGGVRSEVYALSSHTNELERIRAVIAYHRENVVFPMDGGAVDFALFERELRVIFQDW